jgi:hypothetical protein
MYKHIPRIAIRGVRRGNYHQLRKITDNGKKPDNEEIHWLRQSVERGHFWRGFACGSIVTFLLVQ